MQVSDSPLPDHPRGPDSGAHASAHRYRADIDGLRAIAVLSVLVYHIQPSLLPGGFTGVDIFFVISGYLITSILRSEIEQGRFSFSAFYMRRVRRIAPALLAVTAVTLVAGSMVLLPEDMHRLARAALWAILGLGNVHAWLHLDTDYFADASEEEPLLHLWSLGVEEQFYFLWPALLLLLWRRARWRRGALLLICAIAFIAFILGEASSGSNPEFAFYMLPSRAGELLGGALLALVRMRNLPGTTARWILAAAGIALLAYSLFGLNGESRFPGLNALPAVLGTVALIQLGGSAPANVVSRVLALPPLTFIGRISYSLYLVHWPLLALYRYTGGKVGVVEGSAIALISILLAWLSYVLVETPARNYRGSRRVQLAALVVSLFAIALPSWWLIDRTHSPSVAEAAVAATAQQQKVTPEQIRRETAAARSYSYNCQQSVFDPNILSLPRCISGDTSDPDAPPRVLLWGDSMAGHYLGALSVVAENNGIAIRNATHSACPPVFFGEHGAARYRKSCSQFRSHIRAALAKKQFDRVVMSGSWTAYDTKPGFRHDLAETIRELSEQGVAVILIGEAPRFPGYQRECEIRSLARNADPADCRRDSTMQDPGPAPFNSILEQHARSAADVTYLDLRSLLCDKGVCSAYVDDRPAYFDSGHISMDGSWRLGRRLYENAQLRQVWSQALAAAHGRAR